MDGAETSETSQFNHAGLEARETLAVGEVFPLDIPVYSTYPQVVQQHRQLSCRSHDRSLLSLSSATLRQFQSPASEVTIDTEWSQNVLRSLHQQRPQIRIALFADVQLRLTRSRVPASWLQSQITAHIAALREAMRIFQRQQESQRDQRAHSLDLLQQLHLPVTRLRQCLDPVVVLNDPFAQLCDGCQQRL